MKNLLFLFILIASINGLNAQIINFPDANFKTALLNSNSVNFTYATDINGNSVSVDANQDGNITITEALLIYRLYLSNLSISDMSGIENFVNLTDLICDNNQLTSLDLTQNTNLLSLGCFSNQLSQLFIQNLTNLQNLNCYTNNLTTIDLTGVLNLDSLSIAGNLLTSIDISNLTKLRILHCTGNKLTDLNISTNKKLKDVSINMNNLISMNLKNGKYQFIYFYDNPTLKYVCSDNLDMLDSISKNISNYGYTNVSVNSYCSFKPGGDYNTIKGNIIYDLNNNGCDPNDPKNIAYTKITYQEGLNSGITYSDTSGNYNFYTPKGNFQVIATVENPSLFSFLPPTALITFTDSLNNITTQDFCITPIGSKADVEVVLNPIQRARPGFDAHYQLVYKNKGNQTLSGMVNLLFNDSLIDFLSSSITPVASSVGN